MRIFGLDDYVRADRRHRDSVQRWLRDKGLFHSGANRIEETDDGRVRVRLILDEAGMPRFDTDGELLYRWVEVDGTGFPWPKEADAASM